ncbi:ATP-dependent helicase [Paenibacillus sp. NEAU-GSW1]|uniref:ATP-dependent helicase n=1 Tax=Paenibacillus sp. NEAU-GSW1 TaxID=2682486 RepID=UPI0012E2C6F2|nr:ATP-dependent helicase [Paenibacillus sp. NEAU-GSW1]MUT67543.1 AAA family ATPase [Paenibacillus sp. NEAU-GSW1]
MTTNQKGTNQYTYFKRPFGIANKNYTAAVQASARTSEQLVPAGDNDSAYFRSLEAAGIRLNERQIAAVRHSDGPLLTLAGAGSGKTSVLVCRTGYLLSVRGVQPHQLLLMTFSKKAAEEMKERIARLPHIGESAASAIEARTFHAFCLLLLRRNGFKQTILGESGRKQIFFKKLLRERNLHDTYQPETLIAMLSAYKLELVEVGELPESTEEEQQLKGLFQLYETWKNEAHLIDYDDMLLYAYKLLLQDERLLQSLRNRFRYIMIDEFQDTNKVQYELIKLLVEPRRNLMVVGDDDQTIYSFNGARNDYILNFEKQFPGATSVVLDVNYRSGSGIVGLGNAVIRHNKRRRSKTLQTAKPHGTPPVFARPGNSDDEAELIVGTILAKQAKGACRYGDIAVLFRTASSSRAVFDQLVLRQVPFIDYGGGDSFYEQAIIRPVIAHLRLSLERRNFDAMEMMLATLYVSPEQAMNFIWNEEKKQAKKWPLIHLTRFPMIKEFHKEKIKERIKLIRSLETMRPDMAIRMLRTSFYDQFLEAGRGTASLTEHKESLKEMLDELEAAAKRFERIEPFLAFIDEIAAKRDEMKLLKLDSRNADAVNFMTIHKSKGLEFPVVFVCGFSEGILPHSSALAVEKNNDRSALQTGDNKAEAALEEERRLAYVAVTRAQEELYISSPAYYRGKPAAVSPFLISAYD